MAFELVCIVSLNNLLCLILKELIFNFLNFTLKSGIWCDRFKAKDRMEYAGVP